jgi:hypothetical protein
VIDRERRPVTRKEIMLVTNLENRYISEPTETKYLKFFTVNVLGSNGV